MEKRDDIYRKKAKGGYFNRLFDRENIHYTYVDSADDLKIQKGIFISHHKKQVCTQLPWHKGIQMLWVYGGRCSGRLPF